MINTRLVSVPVNVNAVEGATDRLTEETSAAGIPTRSNKIVKDDAAAVGSSSKVKEARRDEPPERLILLKDVLLSLDRKENVGKTKVMYTLYDRLDGSSGDNVKQARTF